MKQFKQYNRPATFLFTLTMAAFILFFLYMGTAERITVYRSEQTRGYSVITDVQTELISDSTAPVGVRKVYRWVLEPEQVQDSSLLFNIAHHDIQVYFDDILVYSLAGAEDNRIGTNVSSNWCSVYAGQEHAGQTVTVVLTPRFEAAMDKCPEFLLGSQSAVVIDVLSGEIPLLVFSSLCIVLGLFVFAVYLYFRHIIKTEAGGMNYLGLFSATLGLWKLVDLRSMPLLLPRHAMAFGYISVGALFLAGLCLLAYFRTLFAKEYQRPLLLLSCGGAILCLVVLAMQVLGIAEIRQNLVFSHILLIAAVMSVPLAALYSRIVYKSWGLHCSWKLMFLITVGIVLDLMLYYRNNGNGLMSFTIMGFIIYTLIVFLNTVQDTTRKAYTDSRTGLVNRIRWNELMSGDNSVPEPYAIVMVDLNGLKQVNDTLGHEAGDQMIFQLSNILRNTLPRSSVICRWGGDEFAILLTGVNRMQLDQHTEELFAAGERYNAEHPELPIHFAVGAALSAEHPGLSRTELFRLADEEMYRNKQLWYRQKQTDSYFLP